MSTWQEIRDNCITTPEDKAEVAAAAQRIYDDIAAYRKEHPLILDIPILKKIERDPRPMDKGIIKCSAHDMVRRILEEWLSRAWSTLDGEDEDDKQLVSAMYEIVAYHALRGLPRVK